MPEPPPAHRPGAAPGRRHPGHGLGGDQRARGGHRSARPTAPPAPRRPSPRTATTTRSSWCEGLAPDSATTLRGAGRRRAGLAGAGERLPAQRDPDPGRRRPGPAGPPGLRLLPGDHPARHRPAAAAGRAGRVRPAADGRPGPADAARTCWCCSATRSTPTSPRRRSSGCCKRRRRPAEGRPGRPGGQLRRVHEALPGVVARPGDPLAALHRAERDDLRRPRDHRRLEHLGVLAGATCASSPGGPSGSASGLASYWVYQHLGNLAPDEIAADPVYAEGHRRPRTPPSVLREFGARVDTEADVAHDTERWRAVQYQWSYALDLGRTRLVMLDNRCSRVLEPGKRAMLPPGEWAWFLDRAHGDYDHLVVGSSLPWLLPPGIHHLEAWNERLADSPPALGGAGSPRSCAGRWTWSTGRRSAARSTRSASCSPGSAAARRARRATGSAPGRRTRRRPRSACSPATCTTRTWPGPGSPTRPCAPRCTSSPAPPSTTRCRPRCAR